jgi:hypothetical protein
MNFNNYNKSIELIKEQIESDIKLYAKAYLLYRRGLTFKEFDELKYEERNCVIFCKEEETKNQVTLANYVNKNVINYK